MIDILLNPWPWYVVGPLIGLMVPFLLLIGNKQLGVSSSLRHLCSACIPFKMEYFTFKKEEHFWNLIFVIGLITGGYLASNFLSNPYEIDLNPDVVGRLRALGIANFEGLAPVQLFGTDDFFSKSGFIFIALGGFLVGFGTRYANGCTSGHTIMGLSLLNRGSLIATLGFFVGGLIMTYLLMPYILNFVL